MPLGRSRPRRDRPSSNDSTKDGLYEQLLASLTQGGEPLATEEEYWRWMWDWGKLHPGERAPSDAMPWSIQRRHALRTLRALTWEPVKGLWEGMQRNHALVEQQRPGSFWAAKTEEELRKEWEQWRKALMETYRLEGLVSQ